MHKSMERLETSGGCSSLFIVHEVALCKALSDIVYFISGNVAHIILFPFADKLTPKGALTMWYVSARHEDENFQVRQTLKFVTGTGDPVYML